MEKSISENLMHLRDTYVVIRSNLPLAVGIREQIAAAHPELTAKKIQVVLGRHTQSILYLRNIKFGLVRVDLDGSEAGKITEDQREVARLKLNEYATRRVFSETKARHLNAGKKKTAHEQRFSKKVSKIQSKIAHAVAVLHASA